MCIMIHLTSAVKRSDAEYHRADVRNRRERADRLTRSLSQPAVSQHLAVLKDAGLVVDDRCGKKVHYRLDTSRLEEIRRAFTSQKKGWLFARLLGYYRHQPGLLAAVAGLSILSAAFELVPPWVIRIVPGRSAADGDRRFIAITAIAVVSTPEGRKSISPSMSYLQ